MSKSNRDNAGRLFLFLGFILWVLSFLTTHCKTCTGHVVPLEKIKARHLADSLRRVYGREDEALYVTKKAFRTYFVYEKAKSETR